MHTQRSSAAVTPRGHSALGLPEHLDLNQRALQGSDETRARGLAPLGVGLVEGKCMGDQCMVPALSGATSGRLRTTPPFLVQRGKQRMFLHVCHFSTAFSSNKHVKVASLGEAYPDPLQWSAESLENTQNYL